MLNAMSGRSRMEFHILNDRGGKIREILVVPRSLHLGGGLSPAYFCTYTEIARNV